MPERSLMDINRKLLEVLLDMHGKSRSGILRIQRDSTKKQLVLHDGRLVFAESNVPREHLAHVMVSMNLLPRDQLKEIASLMKTGKTSEEAILALPDSNIENLEKGRRAQAILIVSSMMGWNSCDVRLYPETGLIRHQLSLGMHLPQLILSSMRHAISKHFVHFPQHFLDGTFTATGDYPNSDFPLNHAETEACSAAKTEKSSSDLLMLIPAGEAKPEETLLCLYHLGLISHGARQGVAGGEMSSSVDSSPFVRKLDNLMLQFKTADFYQILSVTKDTSLEEIQAAYHEQAKQLHPDRFQTNDFSAETRGKAEQVFARINEAYLTLKNPASRAEYDLQQTQKKASGAGPKPGAAQSAETAEGLFREGRILLAKGDLDTAVERLRGCVWLCPEKAAYHYHLGVAESRIPKYRKSAEQHLLRAIELQDMSAETHLALAKLYMDVKLPRKAELQLEQALLWDPHNSEALKLAADLQRLH